MRWGWALVAVLLVLGVRWLLGHRPRRGVYLVCLAGTERPPISKALAEQEGWLCLEKDTWLVASELGVEGLRDLLIARLPGTEVVVMQLQGEWATRAMNDPAAWLSGARRWF